MVEAHRGVVSNIAYRVLGDGEEARDVAQEAFLWAYRGLIGFNLDRRLAPWLCPIVTNLNLNRLRRNPPSIVSLDTPHNHRGPAVPLQIANPGVGPLKCLLQGEV